MKKALITGPFGQDGSYLCELLTEHNYEVHGIVRESLSENSECIKNYLALKCIELNVHQCNLYDYDEVENIIKEIEPCEIYHLAATHYSSENSLKNIDQSLFINNVSATFNILKAADILNLNVKIIVAGSCLMFDASDITPQNENTQFKTKSYYGLAKITENKLVRFFREKGLNVSMAILYNHESPRRNKSFVSSKIVKNMVYVARKEIKSFYLGNLYTIKDWGYAKDYVYGIWLMAQQKDPGDYIFSSKKGHTILNFLEQTAKVLDIFDWQQYVKIKPDLVVSELNIKLIGDYSYAEQKLDWKHSKSFNQLVELMVKNELSGQLD